MNFTTVVVVLTIFGCGTNLFAFLLLATTKMLKDETYNIFLINLCIGDVAYLVTNAMYRASTVDDEYTWPDVLCPLLSYARRGTFYLPIFVYCSLAVERYANAIHRFKLKCRPAIICNAILWAFAFTMALPYYLSYRTELSETKMTTTSMMNASCHTNETQVQQTLKTCARDADAPLWKEYQWAEMVVSYILPIAVCSIFYLRIWWCFRELNMALKDTMLTIISPSIIRGTQAQMEVRKGILKVLALATFIFFVCYTPVFLSILNYLFDILPAWWLYPRTILLQMAVSINPLIFGRLSSSYRANIRAFKANLGGKLRCMVPKVMRSTAVVETIELTDISLC